MQTLAVRVRCAPMAGSTCCRSSARSLDPMQWAPVAHPSSMGMARLSARTRRPPERLQSRLPSKARASGQGGAGEGDRGAGGAGQQGDVSPCTLADAEEVAMDEAVVGAAGLVRGPGVYAVLDAAHEIQFVGLATHVAAHVAVHWQTLPSQHTAFVKVGSMPGATTAQLQAAWKTWIRQHGAIPPGNQKGVTAWTVAPKAAAAAAAAQQVVRAAPVGAADARATAAVTAAVWRELTERGFVVVEDALDAATVEAAAREAAALREAGLLHCVSSQFAQGREDEVLVFNATNDSLVVGVGSTAQRMDGAAWEGLTQVAAMLHGLPHALHAQQHAADEAAGGWAMPPVAAPVSLMLAVYPADGSHYARHLDNDPTDGRARLGPAGQRVSDREVTAIVYLNTGWGSAQQHGGYLRIHPPHGGPPTDVAPVAGRLVLFQARSVEHEVLPAWRTRWAVSAWLPSRAAFAA